MQKQLNTCDKREAEKIADDSAHRNFLKAFFRWLEAVSFLRKTVRCTTQHRLKQFLAIKPCSSNSDVSLTLQQRNKQARSFAI